MSNDNYSTIVSKVPPSPRLRSGKLELPTFPSGLRRTSTHVLKNAGVGYGDYIEQITYLLFLKLAAAKKLSPPSP
jgi:hypothetical protein